MNCKIPFTKDIDFEKKVSEITSISLPKFDSYTFLEM